MLTIEISGTVFEADGVTPKSGGALYVRKLVKGGALISTTHLPVPIGSEGTVSFTLPRDCTAWIDGPVWGFDTNQSKGVAVTIPDAATADLEDLVPATSTTLPGASQAALQAETAAREAADADLQEQIEGIGGGGAWGEITGTLSAQTDLQAALDLKATAASVTAEATARANADAAEVAARDAAIATASTADRARSNHTGQQLLSTISDAGTAAALNVPALGNAAAGEVVKGSDSRLSDSRTPTGGAGGVLSGSYPNPGFAVDMATQGELDSETAARIAGDATEATARDAAIATASTANRNRSNHTGTQDADTLTDGTTNKAFTATERTKLAGVATGATVNATDAQLRDRSTHTGTQTASTVSDFNAAALAAAPAETATTVGALISGATSKTTPVDADSVGLSDSAASNVLKKLTWASLKATLKTYFDTLYPSGSGTSTGTNTGDQNAAGVGLGNLVNVIQERTLHVAYSGANVGTGETDLSTYTLPAGTLSADGKVIRVTAWGTYAATANNKTVRLYFGGTNIAPGTGAVATSNGRWYVDGRVIRTGASAQEAFTRNSATAGTNESFNRLDIAQPAENTANTIVIRVTGQSGTASNDILLKGFIIEILN